MHSQRPAAEALLANRSASARLAVLALALASCAGSAPEAATPATIGGANVGVEAETSTTTITTPETTTSPPPSDAPTTTPALFDLAFAGPDGLLGSGCTPGQDTLPDGTWFGAIDSWGENTFAFDLMCNRIGDGSSVPTISNENPKLRTVVFTSESVATVRIDGGFLMTLNDFAALHPTLPPNERLVIIEVIAGRLTRLELPG